MKKLFALIIAGVAVIALIARAETVLGEDGDGAIEIINDEPGADVATQPEEFVRNGEQIWCVKAHAEIHGRKN
jgi:hypothetical protein